MHDTFAGILTEDENGFTFQYDESYHLGRIYQKEISDHTRMHHQIGMPPISLTMPVTEVPYKSQVLFPFFDGLIPEGWLLDIAQKNWKLDPRDRMSILMATCKDCIGAVSIEPYESNEDE